MGLYVYMWGEVAFMKITNNEYDRLVYKMLPPKIIIIMLPSTVSPASFAELERQPKDERRSRKETSAKIKKKHRQPRQT